MVEQNKTGYEFEFLGGSFNSFIFSTPNGVVYEIKFKPSNYIFEDEIPTIQTYEFVLEVLENINEVKLAFDSKISITVANIFYDFFKLKESVVVYICDNKDGKGKVRNRKFNDWIDKFNRLVFIKFDFTIGSIEEPYFTTIISRIDNPFLPDVVAHCQKISGFYSEK